MNIDVAREKMIQQQVRAFEVFDPEVLEVLAAVPREDFVPKAYRELAFADTEIPIGHGQRMMTPTVEGRLLQALDLDGSEHVLEIGTGSGFLTACLCRLADRVTSIELYPDLLERAGPRLADERSLELLQMDAMEALPEGPFDAIAVTGSMARFDTRLVDLLAPEGRLFVVVGSGAIMEARLVRRDGDNDWQSVSLFETRLAPLVNAEPRPEFLF